MRGRRRKLKGSVLVLAMIFTLIMAMGLGSLIQLQSHYHKINARNLNRTRALHQAESGIQLVIHELASKTGGNQFNTGWTVSGDDYTFVDSEGTVYEMEVTGL